ncbi:hypothetical protein AXG93_3483s1180 [Marchantia polymorpha subsp. ruderalis]|uniref:Reverse transcriptase/retrotransposon-derived protein RNase H-like domain-containing protein n=1 Tax=Marchantia polymorpha subsp. ruderalis TaxID=1480154 RepID=A0A176WE66_MARPO|nr:hypothetical protein AXG93_3483s1180 [Marchantia polymorpha subsp. ruderalis]
MNRRKTFVELKAKLMATFILRRPIRGLSYQLHTNWSMLELGAVLTQRDDEGKKFVIAYASRSNNAAESRYSLYKGECLASLWVVAHFRCYLFSDGDLMFEKDSVKITRAEEFTFASLFQNAQLGTNGWKTADYKDPMRRAIALGIMHIVRPQQTTYITAWQLDVLPTRERPERRLAKRRKTRSVGSEDISQPKTNEELVKELTLSEAILEQIVADVEVTVGDILEIPEPPPPKEEVRSEVATKTSKEEPKALEIVFPDILQDSIVPFLKYLDTKSGKFTVKRESRSYVELIWNMTKLKRAVAVKREWDFATAMAKERAASLAAECAAAKATLQEQEDRLRTKEMECEVLRLNLVKEFNRCAELEQACSSLRATNENAQKVTVHLCGRLEKSKEAYEATVQRAERLIAASGKQEQLHANELAKCVCVLVCDPAIEHSALLFVEVITSRVEDDIGAKWHGEADEEMAPSWHASAFMCWLRGDSSREYHSTSCSSQRVDGQSSNPEYEDSATDQRDIHNDVLVLEFLRISMVSSTMGAIEQDRAPQQAKKY